MEEVAELVEGGLHLAMGEEGRLSRLGRGEIPADDSDVRGEATRTRATRHEVVHPRTLALLGAGEPVRIEGPEKRVLRVVVELEVANVRVPHLGDLPFHDAEAEG